MKKYKIGGGIGFTQDFEIVSSFNDNKLQVKIGDKAYVDSRSMVHYITGQARGKIQKLDGIELDGYDYENIADLIYKRLNSQFSIKEFLDDYEIAEKDLKEEIEDLLMDIL